MQNLAQKLTLIIPTHYRHHYLTRVLSYYKGSGLIPLVIDSTNVPYPDLARFPDVDYRHCPDVPFMRKIDQPVLEISTPYTVFCADDSFVLPRAMAACVEFLEAHADYAAAHGRQISVTHKGRELVFAPCYTHDARLRIDSDDPAERLKQLFRPHSPTFWAVHRTEYVRSFVASTRDCKINDVLLELVGAMQEVIGGKHAVLPWLYHVTERVPSILDGKKRRPPGADAICRLPEHRAAYEEFLDVMSDFYVQHTGSSRAAARKAILESVEAYLALGRMSRRRPFYKKLPCYFMNTLAGLGWRSNDYGSWAETLAHKAKEQAGPGQELEALLSLFDEKSRTELASISRLMSSL